MLTVNSVHERTRSLIMAEVAICVRVSNTLNPTQQCQETDLEVYARWCLPDVVGISVVEDH